MAERTPRTEAGKRLLERDRHIPDEHESECPDCQAALRLENADYAVSILAIEDEALADARKAVEAEFEAYVAIDAKLPGRYSAQFILGWESAKQRALRALGEPREGNGA